MRGLTAARASPPPPPDLYARSEPAKHESKEINCPKQHSSTIGRRDARRLNQLGLEQLRSQNYLPVHRPAR
jgi:hypothetical protein